MALATPHGTTGNINGCLVIRVKPFTFNLRLSSRPTTGSGDEEEPSVFVVVNSGISPSGDAFVSDASDAVLATTAVANKNVVYGSPPSRIS
mmetsp:Transcript_27723/g.38987  ORF Transcript_27723/g.38987 Transcript_27723/m.38987 type:complete len:91 (+) Transcript_27723:512-784(+)